MKTYFTFLCKAKSCLIVFLCFTMYQYTALAQRQVIGRVIDKETKQPIHGATVTIHGADSSTVTNRVGYFQLAADTSTYLVISSPGYENGLIKVPADTQFQLCLTKKAVANDPGEYAAFYLFFQKNLRYPDKARWGKITGRVYVSFETDSLGELQHITLLKEPGGNCGKEVLRVLEACPKQWIPSPANTKFILPITFIMHGTGIEPDSIEKEVNLPTGKLLGELVVVSYIGR